MARHGRSGPPRTPVSRVRLPTVGYSADREPATLTPSEPAGARSTVVRARHRQSTTHHPARSVGRPTPSEGPGSRPDHGRRPDVTTEWTARPRTRGTIRAMTTRRETRQHVRPRPP